MPVSADIIGWDLTVMKQKHYKCCNIAYTGAKKLL
jgi:hypothetical protein